MSMHIINIYCFKGMEMWVFSLEVLSRRCTRLANNYNVTYFPCQTVSQYSSGAADVVTTLGNCSCRARADKKCGVSFLSGEK